MNRKILVILGILIFVSCKQQERIIRQKFQDVQKKEEIEKFIFNGNDEIKTIKLAKINFKINFNNEIYESGGTIVILKDSIIVISLIPLLGYEIARIYCLKEKILVLDRKNKTYYYSPYNKKIGKFYVQGDFNEIESILTGRAFIYDEKQTDDKLKKTMVKEDGYYKYYFEIQEHDFIKSKQEIIVREDNLLTEKNEITDNRNQLKIIINYRQFMSVDYFALPNEINIIVDNLNEKIVLNLNINNIIFNEEVNANIIVPEKYEEIKME